MRPVLRFDTRRFGSDVLLQTGQTGGHVKTMMAEREKGCDVPPPSLPLASEAGRGLRDSRPVCMSKACPRCAVKWQQFSHPRGGRCRWRERHSCELISARAAMLAGAVRLLQ